MVCTYLAQDLDPASRHKILIFCVSYSHADRAVDLLKQAFAVQYDTVEDDVSSRSPARRTNPSHRLH